ncbi:MAG TPA: glycosyl hydrolase family 28-related protein [Puia sp.]|nr:glycosyl hydrolase family 28-related protein [Puia sp.]
MKKILLIPFGLIIGSLAFTQQPPKTGLPGTDSIPATSNTIIGLRKSRMILQANRTVFITDRGRQGSFLPDPADRTTPDDSAMTIVSADGLRLKRITDQHMLDVRWFGATGNGGADDWYAIQKGINYILDNTQEGRTLYFPPGVYKISRPLIIARLKNNTYRQVSMNLEGPSNAKDIAYGSANIVPTFNNTFAIGIQLGKGVQIKDLLISGRFLFPNKLNAIQIDTLSFADWKDGSSRDNPVSPYTGISIDPFSDSNSYAHNSDMYPGLHAWCPAGMNRSGSTAIRITGCSITNFIVGVMITPSNQQNGELVDVIDCDISLNKVAYAMGQAQSKECHVEKLKCWGATHTVFDNLSYGFHHTDGAAVPMVDGVNIAGSVKQLCRIHASSFPGVFRNIYSEELFKIGFVGGNASVSFEDCQLDFTQGPGVPYPDAYIQGWGVSFRNCMLRGYTGVKGFRMILTGTNNTYDGGVMNEPPVAMPPVDGIAYATPSFRNIYMYYSGGILANSHPVSVSSPSSYQQANGVRDPVYYGNTCIYTDPFSNLGVQYRFTYNNHYERTVPLSGKPTLHVDLSKWTGWFRLANPADANNLRPGDFIFTSGLPYQDQLATLTAAAYPVGIIQRIDHDQVFLGNLAYGMREGMTQSLWADYYVYANPPFTGDLAAGSNTLVNVQGDVLPLVGSRPDMPMLPTGTYVVSVDPAHRSIRFSNTNTTGHSFTDFTFMNGYPHIDMYSSFDIPALQKNNKTLIGGSLLHRYMDKDVYNLGVNYLLNDANTENYIIRNSNFNGDTTLHKLKFKALEK